MKTVNRLDALNNEIKLDSEKLRQIAQRVFDLGNEYEQAQGVLRSMQNQQAVSGKRTA